MKKARIEIKKEEFLKIFDEHVKREGSTELREKLLNSDFFEAPASTVFHNSFMGGLCEHSLNVYYRLKELVEQHYSEEDEKRPSEETLVILGLLHDISKMGFYEVRTRNVKDETTNTWNRVAYYSVKDSKDRFTFGTHSENSLFMLNSFIILSYQEQLAILHHMGGKDFSGNSNDSGKITADTFSKSKITLLLHIADMLATFVDEGYVVE